MVFSSAPALAIGCTPIPMAIKSLECYNPLRSKSAKLPFPSFDATLLNMLVQPLVNVIFLCFKFKFHS
jgi:hypothetical protein